MMRKPFVWLLAGFTLWSMAFLLLYGMQATGCRPSAFGDTPLSPASLRGVLIGTLLVAVALSCVIIVRARKLTADDFLRVIATRASIAASVSIVLCFGGVFWLSLCQ